MTLMNTLTHAKMRSTAIATLLSVASGAAFAQQAQETEQQAQETEQTQQSTTQSQDSAQQQSQSQSQSATGSGQGASDQQQDSVVATVGDAEIRGSDVMTVIGMLPPQLQSQPPQMLVPMALEQLILRELILAEARAQNLADDPEVVALVESSAQTAEDDAVVQVWLDREMANVVTDEAVQKVYDEAKSQEAQDLPPLEEVRPQIEQHLRQQAMQDIRMRLREGADIVLYDPTGRPMEQQSGMQDQSSKNTAGETTEGAAGSQSGDAATGSETSGNAAQDN